MIAYIEVDVNGKGGKDCDFFFPLEYKVKIFPKSIFLFPASFKTMGIASWFLTCRRPGKYHQGKVGILKSLTANFIGKVI